MKKYKINEIFYSLQGEGSRSGIASIFIRFSGCNLKCDFCDTKHEDGIFMTLHEIYEAIKDYPCRDIVLTGGEPTLFIDKDFIEYFHDKTYFISMETNGTNECPCDIDFVTLSPKFEYVEKADIKIKHFDELKVVFNGKNNMDLYKDFDYRKKYLQPCDTGDIKENEKIIRKCIDYILHHPSWRLSLQTQKIINVR